MAVLNKKKTEKELVALSRRIIKLLKKRGRARIFLVSGKEMITLKKRYLLVPRGLKTKILKPVDVLAFPEDSSFPDPGEREKSWGEIYLNWDLLRSDKNRLHFLVIHGILHLLGYRHRARRDIIKMEKMEQKLWQQIS